MEMRRLYLLLFILISSYAVNAQDSLRLEHKPIVIKTDLVNYLPSGVNSGVANIAVEFPLNNNIFP